MRIGGGYRESGVRVPQAKSGLREPQATFRLRWLEVLEGHLQVLEGHLQVLEGHLYSMASSKPVFKSR